MRCSRLLVPLNTSAAAKSRIKGQTQLRVQTWQKASQGGNSGEGRSGEDQSHRYQEPTLTRTDPCRSVCHLPTLQPQDQVPTHGPQGTQSHPSTKGTTCGQGPAVPTPTEEHSRARQSTLHSEEMRSAHSLGLPQRLSSPPPREDDQVRKLAETQATVPTVQNHNAHTQPSYLYHPSQKRSEKHIPGSSRKPNWRLPVLPLPSDSTPRVPAAAPAL